MKKTYEDLLPNHYYKVKYMGEWRLGRVIEHEGHKYFYVLDEGINTSVDDIFLEEFYPIFSINEKTGEIDDSKTEITFIDRKK